jgi:hypothetical protein
VTERETSPLTALFPIVTRTTPTSHIDVLETFPTPISSTSEFEFPSERNHVDSVPMFSNGVRVGTAYLGPAFPSTYRLVEPVAVSSPNGDSLADCIDLTSDTDARPTSGCE